jgi:4-hydroxy-tetrahydrodipicolinate synthase
MFTPFGIIPAMVTPITADEKINEKALRQLTNHLIKGGVHGVFAIGSQGEFWAFSNEEKKRVWEVVVEETNKRTKVYAGTAAVTTSEAIVLTQMAEKVGVDAVSVLTPYFITPSEEELYEHYKRIANSTKLPVLLYTNPDRTKVNLSPKLVARLAQIDNIVGIKDSSGSLEQTIQYVAETPKDFATVMGRDTLIFAALMHGAKGAIAATGNVLPSLVVKIYEDWKKGDLEGAKKAQADLAPLRLAFTWGTFPVVIKEALNLIGIEAGVGRFPVGPMSNEQREKLRKVLVEMGAL